MELDLDLLTNSKIDSIIELLEKKYNKDFIYLINNLGEVKKIFPTKIRIKRFKNIFAGIGMNDIAVTDIENSNFGRVTALIPGNIVLQINRGLLWGEDEDEDEDILFFSMYINDTFKNICPKSGVCIALGQYTKQIYNYFLGFTNFNLVSKSPKAIGSPSVNGFVYQISYERDGYKAKSVLKSSRLDRADNLLYEYLAGQYINKQCSVFPCFIQTYGFFKYRTDELWEKMSNRDGRISPTELIEGIIKGKDELQPIRLKQQQPCFSDKKNKRTQRICTSEESLLGFACTNSKYLAILIENVEGKTLKSKMIDSPPFVSNDLLYVLYQVYMPLATLADEYTHYDLHTSNVLVYELDGGKYINYRYVYRNGNIVEFKSKYIAKIIDYGRSYFNDSKNNNVSGSSKKIYDNICKNVGECDFVQESHVCGENYGFATLGKNTSSVMSSVRNISHDLLLLKKVKTQVIINSTTGINLKYLEFRDMLKKVNPSDTGNVEKIKSELGKIENIFDAHNELKKLVIDNTLNNTNNYREFKPLGSLNIYQSGLPMIFIRNGM